MSLQIYMIINYMLLESSWIKHIQLYFSVVQPIGYQSPKYHNYVKVPEMIPEFIVPDLTDFKVSHRMTKPTKWHVHPAKTHWISLFRVFTVHSLGKQSRPESDTKQNRPESGTKQSRPESDSKNRVELNQTPNRVDRNQTPNRVDLNQTPNTE